MEFKSYNAASGRGQSEPSSALFNMSFAAQQLQESTPVMPYFEGDPTSFASPFDQESKGGVNKQEQDEDLL